MINDSRSLRISRHVARMEEDKRAFKILTVIPTEKRPPERPRRRLKANIRIYIKQIGINTRNCIYSTQYMNYWRPLVNAALKLQVS